MPEIRIVVLQRGWVVIGRYSRDGDEVVIDGGYVIERWGTTQGLGQLAIEGETPNTKLRKLPQVRAHQLTVVMTIACNSERWSLRCLQ